MDQKPDWELYAKERSFRRFVSSTDSALYFGDQQLAINAFHLTERDLCYVILSGPDIVVARAAADIHKSLQHWDTEALIGMLERQAETEPIAAARTAVHASPDHFEPRLWRYIAAVLESDNAEDRLRILTEFTDYRPVCGWPEAIDAFRRLGEHDSNSDVRNLAKLRFTHEHRRTQSFLEHHIDKEQREQVRSIRETYVASARVYLERTVRSLICGWRVPDVPWDRVDAEERSTEATHQLNAVTARAALDCLVRAGPTDEACPPLVAPENANPAWFGNVDLSNGLAWCLLLKRSEPAALYRAALLRLREQLWDPLSVEILALSGESGEPWLRTVDFAEHCAAMVSGDAQSCLGACILALAALEKDFGRPTRELLQGALLALDSRVYGSSEAPHNLLHVARREYHLQEERVGRRVTRHLEARFDVEAKGAIVQWTLVVLPIMKWLAFDLEQHASGVEQPVSDPPLTKAKSRQEVRKLLQSPERELRIVLRLAAEVELDGPLESMLAPRIRRLELFVMKLRASSTWFKEGKPVSDLACDVVVSLEHRQGRREVARFRTVT